MKLSLIALVFALLTSNLLQAQEYTGSSFREVMNVIEDRGFIPSSGLGKKEFSHYQQGLLPQYPVNAQTLFGNGSKELERDAIRTVNERFDYYDRLPKKLHANGVCVAGKWEINRKSPYSGYFSEGSEGLFVGRVSVAMEETTSADDRGFGLAGKVFPTLNENEVVKTGNFFTVDVLIGTPLARVLDARTTNEPELGLGFKWHLISMITKISSALKKADESPMFRPLTQVAALSGNEKIKQPHWVRLSVDRSVRRNNERDFRNEILRAFSENKQVVYSIEVSDTTKDRKATSGWKKIGEITLNQAIVSYGCDRRLHFAHPKLK